MLPPPKKHACFALTGGICKVNNFPPPQKYAFFAVMRNSQENIRNSPPAAIYLFLLSSGICEVNNFPPQKNAFLCLLVAFAK